MEQIQKTNTEQNEKINKKIEEITEKIKEIEELANEKKFKETARGLNRSRKILNSINEITDKFFYFRVKAKSISPSEVEDLLGAGDDLLVRIDQLAEVIVNDEKIFWEEARKKSLGHIYIHSDTDPNEEYVTVYQTQSYYNDQESYIDMDEYRDGEVNGREAMLLHFGLKSWSRYRPTEIEKQSYVVGYDDGHLFVTQVNTTARTPEEAIQKLVPGEVTRAQKSGKEVIRWGDIWFVESTKKQPESGIAEITIRENHVIRGWRDEKNTYAVSAVSHPHHPCRLTEGKVYKVLRNKRVSLHGYDVYGYD